MALEDYLSGYDEIGEDEAGYDEIGEDETGAKVMRHRKTGRLKLLKPAASTSRSAGAQKIALKRTALGMGVKQFVSSGSTVVTFEVEPQRDFQPERLIIDESHTSTVTAKALVTSIKLGDIEQLPTGDGMPVEAFARDAVGAGIELSTCKAGTKCKVEITLNGTALASGETMTLTAGFYGEVVGQ